MEKFLVGHGQKWVWPIWSLDCKIDCILRKKLVELTDFLHVDMLSQKLKVDLNFFGWAWSKMGVASLVMRLKNEQKE